MSQTPESGLFSLLPQKRPPWKQFVLSMSTEGLAVLVVAWIGVVHPEVLVPPAHDYHFVQLVETPPPVNHEPAPLRNIKPAVQPKVEQPVQEAREVLRVPRDAMPRVKQPDALPTAPKIEVAAAKPLALPTSKVIIPRQLVKTDVFSTGSSETPTIAANPKNVQTGGFGDPNGVPARETNGHPVNIAQAGSFDLPGGPGYGNGTGGAKGNRGVVASAGFGNGVATGDGSGSVNTSRGNGAVRQSGFGDTEVMTAPSKPKQETAEKASKVVPVEILEKPTPIYSDEARNLHIEGEVLLDVVFESTGKIHVVRVVKGLGHGLDEAAVQAAQKIRFKPALRDGQPSDFAAVLHIIFQLA